METPFFKAPLKGELLKKVTQRYPDMQTEAIQTLVAIQYAAKSLSAILNQPLAGYGLSEGKLYILIFLFSEDLQENEDVSPSDLAENLGVTRATITGLLDGLERDGFVERKHDTRDRRSLTICMTEKSRDFLNEFLPRQSSSIDNLLSPLTSEEKQELIRLLEKVDPKKNNPGTEIPVFGSCT